MQPLPPPHPVNALDEAIRLARAGRAREGIQIAVAVAQGLRAEGNSPLLRRALNVVAICQAAYGRYIEAVSHGLDTYALAHAARDRIEECHALATLAASAGMILDTDEAGYPVLQYCLDTSLALDNIPLEARVRSLLGIRLGTMQRFDEAAQHFRAALALTHSSGAVTPRSMLVLNLAILDSKRMRAAPEAQRAAMAAPAIAATMEAMTIAQREGNAAMAARVHSNLGEIDRLAGNLKGALAQFDLALAIEQSLRSPSFLSFLLIARSEVLMDLEHWEDALDASQQAFDHAAQHRPSRDTATAAGHLADLHARRGDDAQAAEWRRRADQEAESFRLESRRVREKLAELWSESARWAAAA